jgi:hypothetical protein
VYRELIIQYFLNNYFSFILSFTENTLKWWRVASYYLNTSMMQNTVRNSAMITTWQSFRGAGRFNLLQHTWTLVKMCWLETARLCSIYDCCLPSPRTAAPQLQQHLYGVLNQSGTTNSSRTRVPKVSGSITEWHGDNCSPAQLNLAFINTYWEWI